MSDLPRRPSLFVIPIAAALLALPVAALLDDPIADAAGAVLCPAEQRALIVRVSRDVSRDQRFVGSSGATCLCAAPATEHDCRWGQEGCRATAISAFLAYPTMLGIAFAIAALPVAVVIVVLRRRRPA